MSDARNKLLGRAKVKHEIVTLIVDGEPVAFDVHGATAGARGRLLNTSRNDDGTLDYERYYASLVIETVHDADSGERMFSEADFEALNALPTGYVQRLADKAESLSGLGGIAQAALEKNSEATPNVATDSASPNDSAAQ